MASEKGNLKTLKVLKDLGCDINLQDKNGNTCLHLSIINEQKDVTNYLLGINVKQNIKNNDKKTSINLVNEKKKKLEMHFKKQNSDITIEVTSTDKSEKKNYNIFKSNSFKRLSASLQNKENPFKRISMSLKRSSNISIINTSKEKKEKKDEKNE
jgi:ankyrin repeat protein